VGFVVLGVAISEEVDKEDGNRTDQNDVNIPALVKDESQQRPQKREPDAYFQQHY